jgi:cysteine desulfuration protein SufE
LGMSGNGNGLPARLQEIVEDFEWCEGREKIELLIQYAEDMPPLPEHLREDHEAMQQVRECMTPVFVKAETKNGRMKFYFDVPESSPTVRGYASILGHGLEGATPEEVLSVPTNFYSKMGLADLLTHQRLNGFGAILAHLKRLALEEEVISDQ